MKRNKNKKINLNIFYWKDFLLYKYTIIILAILMIKEKSLEKRKYYKREKWQYIDLILFYLKIM